MMNPIYSKTQFKTNAYTVAWPSCFAIITAYATTGETWTVSENERANDRLKELFESEGLWHEAITGYDPEAGHEEPGFAVDLDWQRACDIGLQFKQDAIYYVQDNGKVYVTYCDRRRDLVFCDIFGQRLNQSSVSSTTHL